MSAPKFSLRNSTAGLVQRPATPAAATAARSRDRAAAIAGDPARPDANTSASVMGSGARAVLSSDRSRDREPDGQESNAAHGGLLIGTGAYRHPGARHRRSSDRTRGALLRR